MPSAIGPIFFDVEKNRSENRFVCADFWPNRKSVRFFMGAAYDKKSVRVRRHPTMGTRLPLSHTVVPTNDTPIEIVR